MILFFLKIVWLFLPAGIANMAPVLVRKVKFLNYPVDFNKNFRGARLFGENKTWRGLFFGVLAAIFTIAIQKILFNNYILFSDLSVPFFEGNNIYFLGLLQGSGALFGDLLKSFFKRQIGIAPGKSWVPFDQIDWIIGALFFANLYISISWQYWIIAIVVFGLVHPLINLIGYWLKIKPNRF